MTGRRLCDYVTKRYRNAPRARNWLVRIAPYISAPFFEAARSFVTGAGLVLAGCAARAELLLLSQRLRVRLQR